MYSHSDLARLVKIHAACQNRLKSPSTHFVKIFSQQNPNIKTQLKQVYTKGMKWIFLLFFWNYVFPSLRSGPPWRSARAMHEMSAKNARNGSAERSDIEKLQSLDMLLPKRSWESRCDLDDLGMMKKFWWSLVVVDGVCWWTCWWWSNINSLQIQNKKWYQGWNKKHIYIYIAV